MIHHRLLLLAAFGWGVLARGQTGAAPGDVDLSFNPGLRVNDYVYSVAAQPDGKVLLGGLFTSPSLLLTRLNPDGSKDPGFNVGTGANGIVYAIALQADGKIIVGGAFSSIQGVNRKGVARLNADGSLDSTFDPGTGTDGRVRALAIQSNGRILIAGDFHEVNQVSRVRLARLNASGAVDASFNPGSGADQEVLSMIAQPDGRVVIGGYFLTVGDVVRNYLCRLNANGTVDNSFDPGEGPNLDVDSIVLQPDGKIVLGGGFDSINGFIRGRVARLHGDGSVDDSFDPGSGADFHVSALAVQGDGAIIVGGNFGSFNGVPRGNIVRLRSDGGVDDTFDPGDGTDGGVYALARQSGSVVIGGAFRIVNGVTRNYVARLGSQGSVDSQFEPNTGPDYPVLAVASAADGRVLMGGYFTVVGGISRHYIARLEADGRLDASFAPGTAANGRVLCIVPALGGQAIIGGLFTSFNGTNRSRLARLNTDGNLDLSFDPGSGANGDVLAIAAQPDGRLLVAGEFTAFDGVPCGHIIRLLGNGRVDPAFNPVGADGPVRCLLLQPDGRILLGGEFSSVDGTSWNRIGRLRSGGHADPDFNPGSGANATVECLALQSDGRILLGGQFSGVGGISRGRLARLHATGGLDTNFTPSIDGAVLALAVSPDDSVILGGEFFSVSGASRPRLARLLSNGRLDASFDPGTGANDVVNALALQTDGRVLAGGFFNTIKGVGRSSLARLETEYPRPMLRLALRGSTVYATWPAAFTNFSLQFSTNLASPGDWTDASQLPILSGSDWNVTATIDIPAAYFRLKSL